MNKFSFFTIGPFNEHEKVYLKIKNKLFLNLKTFLKFLFFKVFIF